MPVVKETYHDYLEDLYAKFGRDTVSIKMNQAAKFCKKDRRTLLADKTFPIKKAGRTYDVGLKQFASWLAT